MRAWEDERRSERSSGEDITEDMEDDKMGDDSGKWWWERLGGIEDEGDGQDNERG